MISALDVYLVMQLDALLILLYLISILGIGASLIIGMEASSDDDFKMPFKYICGATFLSLLLCTVLPSTKTAALMYLVPRLTSAEVVDVAKPEIKDLLDAVKDSLRGKE